MTKFERLAEDATSEDIQNMFGRILAGEIRKPGSFSPSTLHFVSMLEPDVAELIKRTLTLTLDQGVCLMECVKPNLTASEVAFVDQSGF